MTSSSIIVAGTICLLNSLILCNYYFIRKLRQATDDQDAMIERMDHLQQTNGILRRLCSCCSRQESMTNHQQQQDDSRGGDKAPREGPTSIGKRIISFLIGKTIMDQNCVESFPGWRPIPLKVGAIFTSILLLSSVLLVLSDDYVKIGVTESQSSEFCSKEKFRDKNEGFEEFIYGMDVTNYHLAKKQFDATMLVSQALVQDTTLFGEEGYTCPGENGTKQEYSNKQMDLEYGSFFPGYCQPTRQRAMNQSQEEECNTFGKYCISDNHLGTILGDSSNVLCTKMKSSTACLPHSLDSNAKSLENYRIEQLKKNNEYTPSHHLQYMNDLLMESEEANGASKSITRLLKQANFAGDFFVIYTCIAMFFPSPLKLFSVPMSVKANQVLFGMDKNEFLFKVLSIWSIFEYVDSLIRTPNVKSYFHNLVQDPCFLDGTFIKERYSMIGTVCESLVEMESNWTLEKNRIDSILPEIKSFDADCDCAFPYPNMAKLETGDTLFSSMRDAQDAQFGQEWLLKSLRMPNGLVSVEEPYLPRVNSTFLGNTLVCYDKTYALRKVFSTTFTSSSTSDDEPIDTEAGFYDIWIASGLLASLLIKISITNYTIAIYKHADPLSSCNGKYEGPPEDFATEFSLHVDDELTEQKKSELKAASIRSVIIWCIVTNLCMFSFLLNLRAEFGNYGQTEFIIFSVFIGIAVCIPVPCYFFTRRVTRKKIEEVEEKSSDDGDNSDSNSDEEETESNSLISVDIHK